MTKIKVVNKNTPPDSIMRRIDYVKLRYEDMRQECLCCGRPPETPGRCEDCDVDCVITGVCKKEQK